MTQTYLDPAVGQDYPADASGTAAKAKDQASEVGNHAASASLDVASTAKLQAQNVADVASDQLKDLASQTRSELTAQASTQQQRAAVGLHSIADELHSMANHSDQQGPAAGLAAQAGSKAHEVAEWLETREPGHLVEEVKGFARQRPAAFLAVAIGAGLLAGRVTRGVKDAPAAEPDPAPRVTTDYSAAGVPSYSTDYPLGGSTL